MKRRYREPFFFPFFSFGKCLAGGKKLTKKNLIMKTFSLKCYDPIKKNVPVSGFFILSRGKNSGRPAFTPNANCFVCTCAPEDVYYFYWLVYGLWYTGRFNPALMGTAIEFIRIANLKGIIDAANEKEELIAPQLPQLIKCIHLEQRLLKQLQMIKYSYVMLFSTFNKMKI